MKVGRRAVGYVILIALGVVLVGLGAAEVVDAYWSGMGGGLLAVSVLRLIQLFRFRKDDSYREKVEIESEDERNRFIRNKAWAWTGYLFVLTAAISGIALKAIGQDLLSLAASYAVCLMMLLYWATYMVLRKKY